MPGLLGAAEGFVLAAIKALVSLNSNESVLEAVTVLVTFAPRIL
jgi:hypothetical protein